MVWKIEMEGIDGSGKTSALHYFTKYLRDRLQEINLSTSSSETMVHTMREVGNDASPACVSLRQIMLHSKPPLTFKATELLAAAMHYENRKWCQQIKPNHFVVGDRGYASHLAYGHAMAKHEKDRHFIDSIFREDGYVPDIIIHLDVEVSVATLRRKARGDIVDNIEQLGDDFQAKVKNEFKMIYEDFAGQITPIEKGLQVQEAFPDITIYHIDGNQNWADVSNSLKTVADLILKNWMDAFAIV